MTDTPKPRGRPKGTGIDDSAALATIAGLMAANSNLKPTTAIHTAGITDPSVVRRLRDKLKSVPARRQPALPKTGRQSARLIAADTTPPPQIPAPKQESIDPAEVEHKSDIISHAPAPRASEPGNPTQATTREPNQESTQPPPPDHPTADQRATPQTAPLDPQLEAMRLAAEAAAAMSRLFLHCANYAAQVNPVTLTLRSQIAMNQWLANALLPPGRRKE